MSIRLTIVRASTIRRTLERRGYFEDRYVAVWAKERVIFWGDVNGGQHETRFPTGCDRMFAGYALALSGHSL